MTNTPSNKPSFSNPVNYVDMRVILQEEKEEKQAEWDRLHELGFTEFEGMLCLGMIKRHEKTYEQIGAEFWPVRTQVQISQFAVAHGIHARGSLKGAIRGWTREEDKYLQDNYGKVNADTIASRLRRTGKSIRMRAQLLAITTKPGRPLKGFSDIKLADRFDPYDRE